MVFGSTSAMQLLEELSRITWNIIRDSIKYDIPQNEEAITLAHFLEVARIQTK